MANLKTSTAKPNRLDVWGDSMMNKLSSQSRKKLKRQASKKRRTLLVNDDVTADGA